MIDYACWLWGISSDLAGWHVDATNVKASGRPASVAPTRRKCAMPAAPAAINSIARSTKAVSSDHSGCSSWA